MDSNENLGGILTKMQKQTSSQRKRAVKRVFWVDAIRAIAIFMVVVIHTSASVLYEWSRVENGTLFVISWNFANVLNSFSRVSVPLFIMVSGAFLLHKKETTQHFLQKRIPKIVTPWIFWGSILLWYSYDFSITALVAEINFQKIAEVFFGGFWFMPLIVGLYLITPLLKVFTKTATTKNYSYFFLLWFISASLIPTLNQNFGISLSIQSPLIWKYLGYYIAGFVLMHKITIPQKLRQQIPFLLVTICTLIALGTYSFTKLHSEFNSSLYEYTNIPVLIASISSFVTLQTIFQKHEKKISKQIKTKVTTIGQASLSIFLSHGLILNILTTGRLGIQLDVFSSSPLITLPVLTILVLSISLFITIGIKKVGSIISEMNKAV